MYTFLSFTIVEDNEGALAALIRAEKLVPVDTKNIEASVTRMRVRSPLTRTIVGV